LKIGRGRPLSPALATLAASAVHRSLGGGGRPGGTRTAPRANAKRFLIEAGWLAVALAVGMYLWVLAAGHYDGMTDGYWTAHGQRPPAGTFWSPYPLMPAFVFGPYVGSLAMRLVWAGTRRWRHSPA
jgi:hypothetical protein